MSGVMTDLNRKQQQQMSCQIILWQQGYIRNGNNPAPRKQRRSARKLAEGFKLHLTEHGSRKLRGSFNKTQIDKLKVFKLRTTRNSFIKLFAACISDSSCLHIMRARWNGDSQNGLCELWIVVQGSRCNDSLRSGVEWQG